MKVVALLLSSFCLAAPAMARPLICSDIANTTNQGYEASISGKRATLKLDGQQIAKLRLTDVEASEGGDQASKSTYSDNVTNGYTVVVSRGQAIQAEVFRAGVAGKSSQAVLNICR